MRDDIAGEIVMYAKDVDAVAGNWRLEADESAAASRRLTNPNAGAAKLSAPLAAPADYVEFRFEAQGGVDYHLWMRARAEKDYWGNDSVFVQFSDSVTSAGAAAWRIGTTSATSVNLEDCSSCGVQGWGWQDNGYGAGVLGTAVRFAATGTHKIRIQRREDGFSFDQIVLSRARFATRAPGSLKNSSTVLFRSGGSAATPTLGEIVLHTDGASVHGGWRLEPATGAASSTVARHPDAGGAKVVAMPVPAVDYFEVGFQAEAGRAYRLWVRGRADRNYWGNDSVHVQFSNAVDATGNPIWRIGSASSTPINLEDCSSCGLSGWGWQDNGYGANVLGPLVYFQQSGPQVIRITTREDGLSIDQIVLSSGRYLSAAPGTLKNDTTVLAKTQ